MKELSAVLKEIALPASFLESYDPLECLSHSHGTETYLVQRKGSKNLCIAKCYDRKIYKTVGESLILKSLHHEGLPAFFDEYQDDATVCIVREYIEGTSLDQYAADHSLSETRIVALCVGLCDILQYIHGQKPPVIHRDVKPQNIIVKEDGHIALIDFDIARIYDDEAETDTQFIATRAYAPPEQYGFSQTDCRADIYSLGVLLCFLLTGKTDVKNTEIPNKRISAVLRRCAAFSPEERFTDAAAVKKALQSVDGRGRRRFAHVCFSAVLALLCLCAGFGVGRYTDFLRSRTEASAVQFTEPLMEQAVRVQLGKSGTEPITEKELLTVREIYIFGNEVSKTSEAFAEGLGGPLGDTPRGTLVSLADTKLLPNLEVLYVNYQALTDISPVAELRYLTDVSLRHTFVEDITALSGMQRLRSLVLFDTHIKDASALGLCPALNTLDVGETLITSLDALPQRSPLETLSLAKLPLSSIDGIERFENLKWLSLKNTGVKDLSALAKIPGLAAVNIDESMRGAAEEAGEIAFEISAE
ncbi:MAG: protein kinase [Pseudoflavonifractor sp.]|nr:protein kinase [Pseudoflavonifractor sp.]